MREEAALQVGGGAAVCARVRVMLWVVSGQVGVRVRRLVSEGIGVSVRTRVGVAVGVSSCIRVGAGAAAVRRLSVPIGRAAVAGGVVLRELRVFLRGPVRGTERCATVGG